MNDLRFAFRMLAKNRGFTAVAALTLALGIGANTAVFSFLDRVFLRPLPVAKPQELEAFLPDIRQADRYYLYGVHPWDPLTYFVAALVVSAVALAACWIPARRAAKTEPMVALRHE